MFQNSKKIKFLKAISEKFLKFDQLIGEKFHVFSFVLSILEISKKIKKVSKNTNKKLKTYKN